MRTSSKLLILLALASPAFCVSVSLSPLAKLQFFDNNGVPLSNGKVYTYASGTSTPQASYTDSTGNVANTNPVILDSAGRASIWLINGDTYTITLQDSSSVQIWSVDGIVGIGGGSGSTQWVNGSAGTIYYSGGNVGIHTATPSVLFEVNGIMQTDTALRISDGTHYNAFTPGGSLAANVSWALPSADAAGCFKSNGSGVMSISACSAPADMMTTDTDQTVTGVKTFNVGILGSTTSDIGSASTWFRDQYLSGTAEATDFRVYTGTPAAITTYFDIKSTAFNEVGIYDSSNNVQFAIQTYATPTQFVFNGVMFPNGTGTFDLGGAGENWRDLYITRNVIVGGATGLSSTITVKNSSGSNCTITFAGGIVTGSTC